MWASLPRLLFRKIWNNLLLISDWIIHSRGINTGETWKLVFELLEKVYCKNYSQVCKFCADLATIGWNLQILSIWMKIQFSLNSMLGRPVAQVAWSETETESAGEERRSDWNLNWKFSFPPRPYIVDAKISFLWKFSAENWNVNNSAAVTEEQGIR